MPPPIKGKKKKERKYVKPPEPSRKWTWGQKEKVTFQQ